MSDSDEEALPLTLFIPQEHEHDIEVVSRQVVGYNPGTGMYFHEVETACRTCPERMKQITFSPRKEIND